MGRRATVIVTSVSALRSGLEETIAARVANLAHGDLEVFGLFELDRENGVTTVVGRASGDDVVQPARDSQLGGGNDGACRVARGNADEGARWRLARLPRQPGRRWRVQKQGGSSWERRAWLSSKSAFYCMQYPLSVANSSPACHPEERSDEGSRPWRVYYRLGSRSLASLGMTWSHGIRTTFPVVCRLASAR